MKRTTSSLQLQITLLLTFFLTSLSVAQTGVGIGTTNPSESLDVVGNIELSGALMPNNVAGNANQLLLSSGANAAPVWGLELLNTTQTTRMGKFFSGPFNITSTALQLTLTDPNCTVTSTCALTWINLQPGGPPGPAGPDWEELSYTVTAQAGQWMIYIKNNTGYSISNIQFSFMAFY